MANLTRAEREQMINDLLTPDISGPIHAVEHRAETNGGDEFALSFIPIKATTDNTGQGNVKDSRLINRIVGMVQWIGGNVMDDQFDKPFASDTLSFKNDTTILGEKVIITFIQQLA